MKHLHGAQLQNLKTVDLPVNYLRTTNITLTERHVDILVNSPSPDGALLAMEHLHLNAPGAPMCIAIAVAYDLEQHPITGTVYFLSHQELNAKAYALSEKPVLPIFPDEKSELPPTWMELPHVEP